MQSHDVVLLSGTNNPHIYAAFNDMIFRIRGDETSRGAYARFFAQCADPERPGVFYRWPGGAGGPTSHDEIMGAAYFSEAIARRILAYLEEHRGNYDTHKRGRPPIHRWDRALTVRQNLIALLKSIPTHFLRWNVYRILWLRPYLFACAGLHVSTLNQLIWGAFAVRQALTATNIAKVGPGRRLRFWLMSERMQDFPVSRLAVRFFLHRMQRSEATLVGDLKQEGGHPDLFSLMPTRWIVPTEPVNYV